MTALANEEEKRSKKPTTAPPPGGLTKQQGRRFLELLRTAERGWEPWDYLRARLPNHETSAREEVFAQVNLWAARQGKNPYCLTKAAEWVRYYQHEELLFLLDVGRDRMDLPDEEDPLDTVGHYAKVFADNMAAINEIVAKHERAIDWQASRIRGFRLMSWLAMPDAPALQLQERLGLVAALARKHVWDPRPDRPLPALLEDSRFLARNGGRPWTARDLALAIGGVPLWIDALMKLEDENGPSSGHFARVQDIFYSLTMEEAERYLPDYDASAMPDDLWAFEKFFRERRMTPAEMVRLARTLSRARARVPTRGDARAPSRLVDVLCLVAGPQLPEVDDLIKFTLVDDEWVKRYIAFFVKMPPERRRALVMRDLADEMSNGGGLLVIAADPALATLADRYAGRPVCPAFLRRGTKPDCAADDDGGDGGDVFAHPTRIYGLARKIEPLADDRVEDSSLFSREALMVLLRWSANHPRPRALFTMMREKLGFASLEDFVVAHEERTALLAWLATLPNLADAERALLAKWRRNTDIERRPLRGGAVVS